MNPPETTQALNALVDKARSQGEADLYIGGRRWKRYRYGTRLEVTRDPAMFASSWYVTTHNVSAGGVGFWSKQSFTVNEPLYVRERTSGKPGPWLPCHVRYCTTGVNGFLLGIMFDHPGKPDAPFEARGRGAAGVTGRGKSRAFFSSLRNQGGMATGVVGATASLAVLLLCRFNALDEQPITIWACVVLIALLAGFAIGWLLLWRESHVLSAIRRATDGLACGVLEAISLPEAGTREVAAVRQTMLDLGLRWQQQANLDRLQRQRLEEIAQIKTNVLSTVSHDLRTPLTSIQLYAQMMEEDLTNLGEEDHRRFLGVISEECTRLSRLVDDLLEVQRADRDGNDWPMQAHDLSETVRTVAKAFEPLATSHDLTFEVSCPEELTTIWCNPDKIAQAINNLLSNALKFTDAGGRIDLTVRMVGAEVVISVADSGQGIPRDKWDVVFEQFVQLSSDTGSTNRGVGLGLHITRQVVERHNGRVWLDSEVGAGTEFFIALPIAAAKTDSTPACAPDRIAGQVLVCDADPELTSIMAHELRAHGFEVRQAHCASRFFELIAQHAPDIVICDIVLPDMTYRDFCEAFEQNQPRPFKLILHPTAGGFDDHKRFRPDIILQRPLTRSELSEAAAITMFKHANRGAVVVVIAGWGMDVERMVQALSAGGHFPLAAKDVTEAVDYIRKYSVDAVFVFVGPEGADSPKRAMLEEVLPAGADLCLLMNIPDEQAKPVQVAERIFVMPYQHGQEDETAADFSDVRTPCRVEVAP